MNHSESNVQQLRHLFWLVNIFPWETAWLNSNTVQSIFKLWEENCSSSNLQLATLSSLYWSPNFMYTTMSCYSFVRIISGSIWNGMALKCLRGTNEYGFIVFFHQFEVVDRRLVPSKSLNLVWKLKVNNIRLERIAVIQVGITRVSVKGTSTDFFIPIYYFLSKSHEKLAGKLSLLKKTYSIQGMYLLDFGPSKR